MGIVLPAVQRQSAQSDFLEHLENRLQGVVGQGRGKISQGVDNHAQFVVVHGCIVEAGFEIFTEILTGGKKISSCLIFVIIDDLLETELD